MTGKPPAAFARPYEGGDKLASLQVEEFRDFRDMRIPGRFVMLSYGMRPGAKTAGGCYRRLGLFAEGRTSS